jgi:hypothetical protein
MFKSGQYERSKDPGSLTLPGRDDDSSPHVLRISFPVDTCPSEYNKRCFRPALVQRSPFVPHLDIHVPVRFLRPTSCEHPLLDIRSSLFYFELSEEI